MEGTKPSLGALAHRLGVGGGSAPPPAGNGAEGRSFDEVMDCFIEEHARCCEFKDHRYNLVFEALQGELGRMTCPPLSRKVRSSRARTLRVLQCLGLLTRDPALQLAFFERAAVSSAPSSACTSASTAGHPTLPAASPQADGESGALTHRERQRERGRDRGSGVPAMPPPVPSSSSRAPAPPAPHPPAPSGSRPGVVSASPRRTKWRSPERRGNSGRAHSVEEAIGEDGPGPCAVGDRGGGTSGGQGEKERGVRLPPLESPRRPSGPPHHHQQQHQQQQQQQQQQQHASGAGAAAAAAAGESGLPGGGAAAALLRLLSELAAEYLADASSAAGGAYGQFAATAPAAPLGSTHAADASAGAGVDARLAIKVTGQSLVEIVGMLSRYATTEARQLRIAQLGVLRPLACLLCGASDPSILRCALEALVHFTARRNAAVLAELGQLSMQEQHAALPAGAASMEGQPPISGPLRQCLLLLASEEEAHAVLAARLLEQLLEAPELRQQLRKLRGIPSVLGCLQLEGCWADFEATAEARAAAHLLRCCQKLARDHVELRQPRAVYELREHDALGRVLRLVEQCCGDLRSADFISAALDALAQMCMDDECATAMRQNHPEGFVAVGSILLDQPWRSADERAVGEDDRLRLPGIGQAGHLPPVLAAQCAAARLLRFLFAVERNRKTFKEAFPAHVLTLFVDIGNYIWPLEAYQPFLRLVRGLSERDAALLRDSFRRACERGAAQRRPVDRRAVDPAPADGVHPAPGSARFGDGAGPGCVVGGYEILECVGAGAFGRVHLARRADTPGDFALKEVDLTPLSDCLADAPPPLGVPGRGGPPGPPGHAKRPGRCSTPRMMEQTMVGGQVVQDQVVKEVSQEVQLLRQLDHPNIVQYHASFTTGSTLWIVMEFCSGVSLQGFTTSAREKGFVQLPEEQTWQIFVQLCLALRYLHVDKGIAHRDLTPNNVLVQSHTLAVKIADFGLARQKLGTATAAASMMKSMVGTILYCCPEIVQHQPYTHKADVWALGCLLYKMAKLRDPFHGSNPLFVARKIVECEYEPLDGDRHSEMLVSTCRRCLTVTPDQRPDIKEVCQLVTPAIIRHLETLQRTVDGYNQRFEVTGPLALTPATMGRRPRGAASASGTARAATAGERTPEPSRAPSVDSLSPRPPRPRDIGSSVRQASHERSGESALSALSTTSEHQQSFTSSRSARSRRSPRSPSADRPRTEGDAGVGLAGCTPTSYASSSGTRKGSARTPRTPSQAPDSMGHALLLVHRLAFLGQLPPAEGATASDARRRVVQEYHRCTFGRRSSAALLRREVSRLAQRSTERVDCGADVRQKCPELAAMTYERLYGYILQLCAEHGYEDEDA